MSDSIPDDYPKGSKLVEPTYRALVKIGGRGTIRDIYDALKQDKIITKLPYDPEDYRHPGRDSYSELYYRMAWALTALKNKGRINNLSRGHWCITPGDTQPPSKKEDNAAPITEKEVEGFEDWNVKVLDYIKKMDPFEFEILVNGIMDGLGLESKTTKRTRDGGVDGEGVLIINRIPIFRVQLQCKRYGTTNKVDARDIRDFRGSLNNNVQKGIFVTTGSYTADAKKESKDDAKGKQIELIDGNQLVDLMTSLKLGVIEKKYYVIDEKYFKELKRQARKNNSSIEDFGN